MKEKFIQTILNLIKVKSIITFLIAYVFVRMALNDKLEAATVTAIIMMVFQNLFDKSKKDGDK